MGSSMKYVRMEGEMVRGLDRCVRIAYMGDAYRGGGVEGIRLLRTNAFILNIHLFSFNNLYIIVEYRHICIK